MSSASSYLPMYRVGIAADPHPRSIPSSLGIPRFAPAGRSWSRGRCASMVCGRRAGRSRPRRTGSPLRGNARGAQVEAPHAAGFTMGTTPEQMTGTTEGPGDAAPAPRTRTRAPPADEACSFQDDPIARRRPSVVLVHPRIDELLHQRCGERTIGREADGPGGGVVAALEFVRGAQRSQEPPGQVTGAHTAIAESLGMMRFCWGGRILRKDPAGRT